MYIHRSQPRGDERRRRDSQTARQRGVLDSHVHLRSVNTTIRRHPGGVRKTEVNKFMLYHTTNLPEIEHINILGFFI